MFFRDKKPTQGDMVTFSRNARGAKAGDKAAVRRIRQGLIFGYYLDVVDTKGRRRTGVDPRDIFPL